MRLVKLVMALGILSFFSGLLPAQISGGQPVDVVLALDNSGSMKQNDPHQLLKEAVVDFASHLPPRSRLGIVIFDERVGLALKLTSVSDPSFHSRLSDCLRHVDYSGKWTDIPGGIERAIYTLSHDGRPDARHAIVFFTDGVVETGDKARDLDRSRWLRDDLTSEAKQRGIRIFGVAFTETADYELIQTVAQKTDGEHYRIIDPSEVGAAFQEIGTTIQAQPAPSITNGVAVPTDSKKPRPWLESTGLWVVAGLLIVVVLVLAVLRKRGRIPSADVAHLIDIGKHSGRDRIPIRKPLIRIGRNVKLNDVCISDGTVSSEHAVIEYRNGQYFLRDLRSSNGTYVNGKRMSDSESIRETQLKSGDRLRFDAFEFIFNLDASTIITPPGASVAVANQRTVLRGDRGVPGDRKAEVQQSARISPAPTLQKPAAQVNGPAATAVKNLYCPTHSSWLATELCTTCGVGKCKQCMVEGADPEICVDCAHAGRKLT